MKTLFVMDPLERINVGGDSTYMTMREHSDRGWPVWMCTVDDLYSLDGRAFARSTPVRTTSDAPYFHTDDSVELDLGDVDLVWMRKDPPFDMRYIFTTYLLEMVPPSTRVLNGPQGLKLFNEKLWAQQAFARFQPATLLSADIGRIRAFVKEQGRAVLKPWDGNGGRGVLVTHADDRNLSSMIELLSEEGSSYVIAQAFLPQVEDGDKRILIFDGEPVGAMLRLPQPHDYRANMHVGAKVAPTELSEADIAICDALRPLLKQWDQLFVGIDTIGGYLTEINVTSPTGIREINRLYDTKLEVALVDSVLDTMGR